MSSDACSACGALLGWAEPDPCGACNNIQRWNADATDRLYQVLCRFDVRPAKIDDLHRVARAESSEQICHYSYARGTVHIYVPQDPRFCWAGRGIYGLSRDGLLPGPRNLAGVAALILCAATEPLTPEQLEFVLKRMGYRFQLSSLINAMSRTAWFKRSDWWTRWDINRGRDARRAYRAAIDSRWPARRFEDDLDALNDRVRSLLDERSRLQHTAPDLSHLDDDWTPGR